MYTCWIKQRKCRQIHGWLTDVLFGGWIATEKKAERMDMQIAELVKIGYELTDGRLIQR